jgi:hypothetical protein
MFKWGLLLTCEDIIFNGEPFRDEESSPKIRIPQRRLCFTELAENELPNHAQVFGPIALEFDQRILRRIGVMPVIYIPQPLSNNPERDVFSLIGQTLVYRLNETYQILADLAQIQEDIKDLPFGDHSVTLEHPETGFRSEFPVNLLQELFENLTYRKQPLSQLAAATRLISCFFYYTDAPTPRLIRDDGRLAYYREREWRVVSGPYFAGASLEEELPPKAKDEIASLFDNSFSPYEKRKINGSDFVKNCSLIRRFERNHIMNSIGRILVPEELKSEVTRLAHSYNYKGIIAGYCTTE